MFKRRFVATIVVLATLFVGNPVTARFLQVDPVGYKDQVNLYTYVDNDPTNRTDPTGLESAKTSLDALRLMEEARQQNPNPQRDRMDAIGMAVIYTAAACSVGACNVALPIANRVFRSAENNPQIPSSITATKNAQSVAADAAERIAPLAGRRGLGEATASRTGGTRFFNPKTGDSIRVEPGNPNANFASGRQPYVKESFGGTVRDAGGNPIMPSREFPNPSSNPASHIPAETYLKRQGL